LIFVQRTLVQHRIGNTVLELHRGDITGEDADAIVNAANEHLKLGAGVAGAIRRRGGPTIQQECDKIGYCPSGHVVITPGGDLKARFVIHAVGPRQGEGDEEQKLVSATAECLAIAEEKSLRSIALPAISTGVFGFPMKRCAYLMLSTCLKYMKEGGKLREIIFVLFDEEACDVFAQTLFELSHKE
jgi:O-acetyl-ADP-ribose deacetylase (regulator of RNase III)